MVATSSQGRLLGRPVRTNFLVDSGADLTVAHESHAATLGLDLSNVPVQYMEGVETAAARSAAHPTAAGGSLQASHSEDAPVR